MACPFPVFYLRGDVVLMSLHSATLDIDTMISDGLKIMSPLFHQKIVVGGRAFD